MGQPRVRDVVSWHVDRTPVLVAASQVVSGTALFALAVIGNSSGPSSAPWPRAARMPAEPDDSMDVGSATLSGSAGWMPRPALGPQALSLSRARASINPTGLPGRDVPLPLPRLRLIEARPRRRSRSRHETAQWVLTVRDGEHRLEIAGPWLALCWLGHLAGWPEPPRA